MNARRDLKAFLAIYCCAALVACGPTATIDQLPPYIRPLPGASHVTFGQKDSDAVVSYRLPACYPAERELATIKKRIPVTWIASNVEALNPGYPTSHVRGWTRGAESKGKRIVETYTWSGEWRNGTGAVLKYDLTYRTPSARSVSSERPAECSLQVTASILSRETIERLSRAMQR